MWGDLNFICEFSYLFKTFNIWMTKYAGKYWDLIFLLWKYLKCCEWHWVEFALTPSVPLKSGSSDHEKRVTIVLMFSDPSVCSAQLWGRYNNCKNVPALVCFFKYVFWWIVLCLNLHFLPTHLMFPIVDWNYESNAEKPCLLRK